MSDKLGIINAVGLTIAREVDSCVYVYAGPEISVASTKAFTSQVEESSPCLVFRWHRRKVVACK
jgi:glucosamine 6-phosphate synthetase-like amidotransferase/phosphosugar isomerase protein